MDASHLRVVHVNHPELTPSYPPNRISNSKYSWLTFIPLNLYDQFKSPMNRYFLLIACLQLWSIITPVNPITTWAPLGIVFAISAVKEGVDDLRRHRHDRSANERLYTVVTDGHQRQVQSQHILVGDMVLVEEGTEVPCDLVFLQASAPTAAGCFLETSNLDGETDLKQRSAPPETAELSIEGLTSLHARIECAPPNADLYRFESTMFCQDPPAGPAPNPDPWTIPLTEDNLLQQGTIVRNTSWVYGVAVYTGNETKVGQNKTPPPTKLAASDLQINRLTILIFCAQLLVAMCLGLYGDREMREHGPTAWYLHIGKEQPWWRILVVPLRFLLLNSMMIPISLKVTLDVVKLAYSRFINMDVSMYDPETDTPANAVSASISEDLGRVQYVLTDKTGTLTNNHMVFKLCSINGQLFGTDETSISGEMAPGDGDRSALSDPRLLNALGRREPHALAFFRTLAICNSVIPVPLGSRSPSPFGSPSWGKLSFDASDSFSRPRPRSARPTNRPLTEFVQYQASSPDEEALVHAAADLGVTLSRRSQGEAHSEFIGLTVGASGGIVPDTFSPGLSNDGAGAPLFSQMSSPPKRRHLHAPSLSSPCVLSSARAPLSPLPKPSSVGSSHDHHPRQAVAWVDRSLPEESYEIVHVLPFTSERKRMSVLVRVLDDAVTGDAVDVNPLCPASSNHEPVSQRSHGGASNADLEPGTLRSPRTVARVPFSATLASRLVLLCKGADDMVLPRLVREQRQLGAEADVASQHLELFANQGLRTLCVAYKQVSEAEYRAWLPQWNAANALVGPGRASAVAHACTLLEQELRLLGCTAIEDKLQDGVPQSIRTLRRAGMKVWMLTGDKYTTALQIAVSCNITPPPGESETFDAESSRRRAAEVQAARKSRNRAASTFHGEDVPAAGGRFAVRSRSEVDADEVDPDVLDQPIWRSPGSTGIRTRSPQVHSHSSSTDLLSSIPAFSLGPSAAFSGPTLPSIPSGTALSSSVDASPSSFMTPTRTRPPDLSGPSLVSATLSPGRRHHRHSVGPNPLFHQPAVSRAGASVEMSRQYRSLGSWKGRNVSAKTALVLPIRGATVEAVGNELQDAMLRHHRRQGPRSRISSTLIIEGRPLQHALSSFKALFTDLALRCDTVICCRASPSQKAQLVQLVRDAGKVALAIGDGGNDCAMILAANVGVGLSGREGLQAARAADYTFSRFKSLVPLCLIHGRYSHLRTAFIAQYCFYKSIFICLLQIMYNFFCDFSGCSFLDTFSLTTYNMIFTAAPVLCYVFERDREPGTLLRYPEYYKESLQGMWITPYSFARWVVRALFQSVVVFLFAVWGIGMQGLPDGTTAPQGSVATLAFASCLLVQAVTIASEATTPTLINHLVNCGCLLAFFILSMLRSAYPPSSWAVGVFTGLLATPAAWATALIGLIVAVAPWLLLRYRRGEMFGECGPDVQARCCPSHWTDLHDSESDGERISDIDSAPRTPLVEGDPSSLRYPASAHRTISGNAGSPAAVYSAVSLRDPDDASPGGPKPAGMFV